MKSCRVCNIEKPLDSFNKSKRNKDGFNNMCKECGKEYAKKYRKENYEMIIQKEREREKSEINKSIRKKYREENKLSRSEYYKKYRLENKDKVLLSISNSRKKRYHNDPNYKLKELIRGAIKNTIKRKGYSKKSNTKNILGCSYDEFRHHIESLWENWMNWDNFGNPKDGVLGENKSWDIDHIIPISSAETEEDVIKLNHYTNLRPLCSYNNRLIKKDKF